MTQYQYDAVGNTVAVTSTTTTGDASQVETRQYDAQNHVICDTVGAPGLTTQTAYDLDGNVAQTVQPNGDTVYSDYDLTGHRLNQFTEAQAVTQPSDHPYLQCVYDGAGNQTSSQDQDGRLHTTLYDGDTRVVQQSDSQPSGASIATALSYDPDGNMVQRQHMTGTPPRRVVTTGARHW